MDASESGYSTICDDFYVNVRLDLRVKQAPDDRTVMDFFERMRRVAPSLCFRLASISKHNWAEAFGVPSECYGIQGFLCSS